MIKIIFWFSLGLVVGGYFMNWHNSNYVPIQESSNTSSVSVDYEFVEESNEEFITRMQRVLNDGATKKVIRHHTSSKKISTTSFSRTIPDIPTAIGKYDSRSKLLATEIAKYYGIVPSLIHAVIKQESSWYEAAKSSAGAIGILQVMPATGQSACGLTESELYDRKANLTCGVKYLKEQLVRFGNAGLALCAYNSGPSTVAYKYDGKCPHDYPETMDYKERILKDWGGNVNEWRWP